MRMGRPLQRPKLNRTQRTKPPAQLTRWSRRVAAVSADLTRASDDATRPEVETTRDTLQAGLNTAAQAFECAADQVTKVVVSCPRFLWTPYCPEKLEDDSVEGNGKTMIDVAGVVGSEGERSSSMLSITGQAAGAGPLAPGQRWSLARKHEVVLRLLRGEPVEAVSRQ